VTAEDMNVIQAILCDRVDECKNCPLFRRKGNACWGNFSAEDEDDFLRIVPLVIKLTNSPAIKKYLAGFLKVGVV